MSGRRLRRLGERLRDGGVDLRRHRAAQHAEVRRRLRHQLGDHRLRARARDRRLAGEHLVEHRGERVDVAACVDSTVARCLLGRHVLRRAEREPRLRESIATGFLHGERDAEVGEHRLTLLDEDVLRLDVAVDELLAVRVVQRTRHLLRDRECLLDPELVLPIQLVAERLAADEGEDVVEEAVRLAGVDEGEDVGMIEPRRDLDLGEEPLGTEHGAELGAKDLEGDVAVELAVAGEVDDRHATGAELALDDVAVVERSCNQGGGVVAHGANVGVG
jgi:hypothetical protein